MDGSAGVDWDKAVPSTGLTVLLEPDMPSLDVVFIHGFTGHPERTWTHKRGEARRRNGDCDDEAVGPPPKARRLNPFLRPHHEGNSNTAVYWPRDLIPITIPSARVLTYGYDSQVRHCFGPPVSSSTVYDVARNFLIALEAERRLEPSRPVLFIAHSLGGIIVKEMLRQSSVCYNGQSHLQDVCNSTIGIVFFGTPHGGSDPRRSLQHIAEAVMKAVGVRVNDKIVDALLPSAERLRELRDEFGPMAQQQNWIIHSFQEEFGIKGLNGRKVVEDPSSYLNLPSIEITQHIGRNHMDMCRFTGLDDVEYKKVAAVLDRMTRTVQRQSRRGEMPFLSEEQRRTLMDSLRFSQIDARQMTIKSAHAKTCRWLLKNSEYVDWLDATKQHEHHGFLWIKGKPGTGKSTLMKFALSNSRKTMRDKIIISFFFNARGADLERSAMGMYRTLLLQLLERLPDLQCVFDSLGFATWNINGHRQWTLEMLQDLFGQAIQMLGRFHVVCFIDALDECDEDQIREMVKFFQHLGELAVPAGVRFHVCFSSRHYPHVTIRNGLSLVLEGQEGHTEDITNYVDSVLEVGRSKLAEKIRIELQEKASGVFMWVVLVVDILNKEHDCGRIHALRTKLRDIPGDLHELFRDILTRNHEHRSELLLCIQWVLFSRRPLSPEELYFAIRSGTVPWDLSKWDADEISVDAIRRFILNSSKGLAEITKSQAPSVQFIHESVRDFLLKENGLSAVWSDLGGNFQGQSHENLKQCCLRYMYIDITTHLSIDAPLPKASSPEAADLRQSAAGMFPFLRYALQNILYHADAAQGGGVNQKDFVQSFKVADWINLDNLLEKHQIYRRCPKVSLLYILAEGNMSNLIRVHPSNRSCFEIEDERYGLPLFAALATGSDEAVRAFLEAQKDGHPPTSPLHDLCKQYCQDRNKRNVFRRDFAFSHQKGVLSCLAENGDAVLVGFALETGKYMLDNKDKDGRRPLSWATMKGNESTVKLLLEKGADIDSKDNHGLAPLLDAAIYGHEAIARLLLEKGADIESKDNHGLTPLLDAAIYGHESTVKLLLEKGAEVESKDNRGLTPLSHAVINRHEAIARMLLEKGADIESKNDGGLTPLSRAVINRHEAIVRLLLEKGADIESKDHWGQTPLSHATSFSP